MAKKKNWLEILIIVLVFGMMVSSCFADQGGSLTITNIPSRFNGKFVILEGESRSREIFGAQTFNLSDWSGTGARISNGRVIIPIWIEEGDTVVRYAGSNTFEIEVEISNSESSDGWEGIAYLEYESISFTNGKATVSFQDADDFDED